MAAGKAETAIAVLLNLGMAIGLWLAADWCWPDGIGSVPLGSLTLSQLGRAAGSILLTLLGFAAVFKAISDPTG